jgi:hypothetical protein
LIYRRLLKKFDGGTEKEGFLTHPHTSAEEYRPTPDTGVR